MFTERTIVATAMRLISYYFFYSLIFILALCQNLVSRPAATAVYSEKGYTDVRVGPSSQYILFNLEGHEGLFIGDLKSGRARRITDGPGSARDAGWSADGRYVTFKRFVPNGPDYDQIPSLYDVKADSIIELAEPSSYCGVPSVSAGGMVAFTIGRKLIMRKLDGTASRYISLPAYANLAPISSDGQNVVFNDSEDRLFLLDTGNENIRPLPYPGSGLFGPKWSADGSRFLCSSFSGDTYILEVESLLMKRIKNARHASWSADGRSILFSRADVIETAQIKDIRIFRADMDGRDEEQLSGAGQWYDFPVQLDDGSVIYSDRFSGKLMKMGPDFSRTAQSVQKNLDISFTFSGQQSGVAPPPGSAGELQAPGATAVYFDIPYLHQRYDTPDWFNGNWACGGTSAVMCLAYYGLLEKWPVSVSLPYNHVSDYGNYISSIYSYNGYTFNIWAYDPDNVKGYGAYGFIVRHGSQAWADTKGYMAEYARKHGLYSSVDWSPSRTELMQEVEARMPLVLLNSLTTAGHYISVIGYEKEATTVIVNDPYGNKNYGYTNYQGKRAKYDWPGYSNGHASLNTVWCYIYFRGNSADLEPVCRIDADTVQINNQVDIGGSIINSGQKASDSASVSIVLNSKPLYSEASSRTLQKFTIPPVAAGDSLQFDVSARLPDSLVSGTWFLGLYVDKENRIIELSNDNNYDYGRIHILGYPRIYNMSPRTTVDTGRPLIRTYYKDDLVAIDTSSIAFYVDGADVTDSCRSAKYSISYMPAEDLSDGLHEVVFSVSNVLGFRSVQSWTFEVAAATSIAGRGRSVLNSETLLQNYPNPFNPTTTIRYRLPGRGFYHVNLSVFNLLGQRVATLLDERQAAGFYTARWNGGTLPAGIYFIRLSTASFTEQRKTVLLK